MPVVEDIMQAVDEVTQDLWGMNSRVGRQRRWARWIWGRTRSRVWGGRTRARWKLRRRFYESELFEAHSPLARVRSPLEVLEALQLETEPVNKNASRAQCHLQHKIS